MKRTALIIVYLVLLVVSAMGLVALAARFREGLIVTNMTQHVPWGFWVALYIYFIGLSAGSFLLSTLIYVFGIKRLEPAGPMALFQALGCLLIGLVFIFIDLGHPERFFNVFRYWNPTSVLGWECFFYTGYAIIILIELYLVLKPGLAKKYKFFKQPDKAWLSKAGQRLKGLGIIGIPVAIGVHGGTGAIFAVIKSRPTWYTGLFPIIFLISALASGGALLTFLMAFMAKIDAVKKQELVRGLARLTIGIVCLDLILIASEVLVVLYGGIPDHIIGWKLILAGPYWWLFWFVQILAGAVIPIFIICGRRTGNSIPWLGMAGALTVVGTIAVRLNIVIPAQIPPEFQTLPEAYHHLRFAWGYLPSANEWLVGFGVMALAILALLIGRKALPLDKAAQEGKI